MNAVFCLWHDHQLSHDHNRSQALPLSHYWHLYTVLWIPTILCIVNTCIVGVVLLEVIGVVILLHPQATNMPTSSTLRPWVCLHNKHMAASDPCSHSGLQWSWWVCCTARYRVSLVCPLWPESGAGWQTYMLEAECTLCAGGFKLPPLKLACWWSCGVSVCYQTKGWCLNSLGAGKASCWIQKYSQLSVAQTCSEHVVEAIGSTRTVLYINLEDIVIIAR